MEEEDLGVDLQPLRHLTEAIARNRNVCEGILETIETLREATLSQNMEFYLADHRTKEIYRCPREGYGSYKAVRHKIGSGSTIAAYVAELRQPIVCHDLVKVDHFPLGVDLLGSAAKRALCVPLVSLKNGLVGVMELTRDKGQPRYNMLEFEMCINVCNWMLPSIEDFFEEENILKENYAYSKLLELTKKCICGHISHSTFFAELLKIIGNILNSESYILYTLNKSVMDGKPVKIARMFVQTDNKNCRRKLSFNIEAVKSVPGTAMLERRIVTAVEKHIGTKYSPAIYKPRIIESTICVPLILNGEVKGAIEYINKLDCDRYSMLDRIFLASLATFIEFNLFAGSLKNLTRKTKLHQIIDHEKFIRALNTSKETSQESENLNTTNNLDVRAEIPSDELSTLLSIDRMLLEVVDIWPSLDVSMRRSFLDNTLGFCRLRSPVLWKKLWSSVEFVYRILKTYSSHFSATEKELLIYSTLFRIFINPHCGSHCLSKEISITKMNIIDECGTFYFVRTIFKKSNLFKCSYLDPLLRKLKVILHSLDRKELSGLKENLFRVIVRKELDLNELKHRLWLKYCILTLADHVLYFSPYLLPLDESLEIARNLEKDICNSKEPEDKMECDWRCNDVAKILSLHLRMNVLPFMILLRIILPETKMYLVQCLEAINLYESFRTPRQEYIDYTDFIDEYFRKTD